MNNNANDNNGQELSPEEKKKAYNKAYYQANKETLQSQSRDYYESNKEQIKDKLRVWYETDKENQKARAKDWYKNNKEKAQSRNKAYQENNKEALKLKRKDYYESTKEKQKASAKRWRENNKEKVQSRNKIYWENNKKELKVYNRVWYQDNKKEVIKNNVAWRKAKKKTDPLFKTKEALRSVVNSTFRRIKKNKPANTESLLGCTWEEAKAHIESLFQEGMTWDNHGVHGWHVDHIRPVSSFSEGEFHLMNHISNLQPLWAEDNLSKRDKFNFKGDQSFLPDVDNP